MKKKHWTTENVRALKKMTYPSVKDAQLVVENEELFGLDEEGEVAAFQIIILVQEHRRVQTNGSS